MATKKQKRAEVAARTEAFLEEQRQIGLAAQEADRRRRELENRKAWEKGHEKHYKFVDECPHCKEIKAKQVEKQRRASIAKIAEATAKAKEKTKARVVLGDGTLSDTIVEVSEVTDALVPLTDEELEDAVVSVLQPFSKKKVSA
jgi:hypothetical protein